MLHPFIFFITLALVSALTALIGNHSFAWIISGASLILACLALTLDVMSRSKERPEPLGSGTT